MGDSATGRTRVRIPYRASGHEKMTASHRASALLLACLGVACSPGSSAGDPPPSTGNPAQPESLLFRGLTGPGKTLFVVVDYPDDAEPPLMTEQEAAAHASLLLNRTAGNSYQKYAVTVDIVHIAMPQDRAFYSAPNPFWTRIVADVTKLAGQQGFDFTSYDSQVIFTPKVWNSTARGLGTANRRTALVSCIIGSACGAGWEKLSLHEQGHAWGYWHAKFLQQTHGSPPYSASGTLHERGDIFDPLGAGNRLLPGHAAAVQHFHPWTKLRLGWLDAQDIGEITTSGTYWVQNLEATPSSLDPSALPSALKIRRDASTSYWLFRRASEPLLTPGVLVTWGAGNNASETVLLDMTPGSHTNELDDCYDAPLAVGQSYTDPIGGLEIITEEVQADRARIRVRFDPGVSPATYDNLPVVNVTSPAFGETTWGTVRFDVDAFDPDVGTASGDGISSIRINLFDGSDDNKPVVASKTFLQPQDTVTWLFDTTQGLTPDGTWGLTIEAADANGAVNQWVFNFLIDNTGPSF